MASRLFFRGKQPINIKMEVPNREVLPTSVKKPEVYKNINSSQMKCEEECSCGLTFDEIINEKPSPKKVAEFIQNYINKIVKEDESDTSDFESSEYQTDR